MFNRREIVSTSGAYTTAERHPTAGRPSLVRHPVSFTTRAFYRGYGGSTSNPTETGLLLDAAAARA